MAAFVWSICVLGLTITLATLLFLCGSSYLIYIHNKYSHIPGPRPSSFFLGNVPELRKYLSEGKTSLDYFLDMYHMFGPVFVIFLAYRPVVYVTDPLYIKQIFVDSHEYVPKDSFVYSKAGYVFGQRAMGYGLVTNSDQPSWLQRRQMINPAFHRRYLKNLMTPLNKVCDRLLKRLVDCTRLKSEEVTMYNELCNATMEIICQVAFSVDLHMFENQSSSFRKTISLLLEGIQDNIESPLPSSLLQIYQWRLFQSENQRNQINAAKFVRDFGRKCISERITRIKERNDVPNDVLSYIVECAEKDETITMEDLIDEFLSLFLAGHETTASSLAFTLFEIISNPEIERKILEEVRDVIGSKEHVDYEDLTKLKYVGQCLMEGLRKFTVATGPFRILTKEIIVGGYKLPAGSPIEANKHAFNRSPNFWNDPDVFNPDRFACPEEIPNFRYVFFPFSLGPRNCIGQTFAMFEEKVLLARLIQKFKFQLIPGQTCKIKERFTSTPSDGVRCTVELR